MSAGRQVIYVGVDGRRWHLHGPRMGDEGVYLTSMAGIYHPVRVALDTRPAYMQGARPGLPKTDPRVMDLKLFTSADSEAEWEAIENRWWDSWSDEADGLLMVESRQRPGTFRDIPLRLQRYPAEPFDYEPEDVFDWTLPTIAYMPWWRGPELTSKWENTDGTGEGTINLANPGDVEIWPQFMVENVANGETYTLPDGLDGDSVDVQLDEADGDVLIDTDQLRMQLESHADTQVAARMAAMKFRHPIPPRTRRTSVEVSVTGGTTAATVKAYMRPYYKRAW